MGWKRKQYDRCRKQFDGIRQKRTSGRRWMSMRHVVLVEEPVCRVCSRKASTQVDHIIPLSKGGTDERDNLEGLCDECHDKKTADDMGFKPPQKIGLDGYPVTTVRCTVCGKEIKPFDQGTIHYEYKTVHVCAKCSFDYVSSQENLI